MGKLAPTIRFGCDPIDRGFEEVLGLIDLLSEQLAMADLAGARQTVRSLADSADHHFRTEQALLRSRGFPRLNEHARLHEAALLMIERIELGLDSGDFDLAQTVTQGLTAFFDGVLRRRKVEYGGFLADGRLQFETGLLGG